MQFVCPRCRQQLTTPDHLAGQVVACPCGQTLQTPAMPVVVGTPVAPVSSQAGVAPPARMRMPLVLGCAFLLLFLILAGVALRLAGLGSAPRPALANNATCPVCGFHFRIPESHRDNDIAKWTVRYTCPQCKERILAGVLYGD